LNASSPDLGSIDCRSHPLWIQTVASAFSLTFRECLGTVTQSTSASYATLGAGVALPAAGASAPATTSTIADQVAAFRQEQGGFGDKDLVTVMAGQNDLRDLFAQFPATGSDALLQAARDRGRALAMLVNDIATSGPAVVVMRIPNVAYTPWARTLTAAERDLLTRLTDAYNTSLQLNLINDGHLIGLVFGDAEVRNMVDYSAAFGLSNVADAWCAQPSPAGLLSCTQLTPSPAASAASAVHNAYLWAGTYQLGAVGQSRLGSLAANRAVNNPF
jgi:outer membrane lipase/esterase